MAAFNKIVWSDGLFLRPHLFQQQERYLEHIIHQRNAMIHPFFWGITSRSINHEALSLGKILFDHVSGVFQDGTIFNLPISGNCPPALNIRQEHVDQIIYLCLPIQRHNEEEILFDHDENERSLARFQVTEKEFNDINSVGLGRQLLQVAQLRLRILPEKDLNDSWLAIPIERIKMVHTDGAIELYPDFMPPMISWSNSEEVRKWVSDIQSLIKNRVDHLSSYLCGHSQYGQITEITDFLLLQLLNRYAARINMVASMPHISLADLYVLWRELASELSTFVRVKTRQPIDYPNYQHLNPKISLMPIVEDLRFLLNIVLERSAEEIDLKDMGFGMHIATLSSQRIQSFSSFVLAVSAQLPSDMLQKQVLQQVKVASSDMIQTIITSSLPGIPLKWMAVAPRQIPFHAGVMYFEITKEFEYQSLWDRVSGSGSMSIHASGDFPELRFVLWGLR